MANIEDFSEIFHNILEIFEKIPKFGQVLRPQDFCPGSLKLRDCYVKGIAKPLQKRGFRKIYVFSIFL